MNLPEKQIAAAALQLLQRVNLQGAEVDTYMVVRAWLQQKAAEAPERES